MSAPQIEEEKKRMLRLIEKYFRTVLKDKFKHPLRLMDDGYALQIRANQNDHIDEKSRKPGYLDVAVRPLFVGGRNGGRLQKIVLRVWTEDRGTGINQKLKEAGFAPAVAKKLPGLKWEISRRKADYNKPHGMYDFWREYSHADRVLSDALMKEMLEDYLAIEAKLVELKIFQR